MSIPCTCRVTLFLLSFTLALTAVGIASPAHARSDSDPGALMQACHENVVAVFRDGAAARGYEIESLSEKASVTERDAVVVGKLADSEDLFIYVSGTELEDGYYLVDVPSADEVLCSGLELEGLVVQGKAKLLNVDTGEAVFAPLEVQLLAEPTDETTGLQVAPRTKYVWVYDSGLCAAVCVQRPPRH
ncbi:MAG: hypothetical protein AAF533_09795 [Acidobacteriota bacterium]